MSEENFDCSHVPDKGPTTVSNTLSEISFIPRIPDEENRAEKSLGSSPVSPAARGMAR